MGRRERARPYARRSFFERYRGPILTGAVVAVAGLVFALTFQAAGAKGYTCSTVWDPEVPSPAPAAPASSGAPSASAPASASAQASPSPSASASAAPSPSGSGSASPSASGPASASPSAGASPSAAASPSAGASPSPSAEPSARLGIVQPDMGRNHSVRSPQSYTYCPPASGNHYNRQGQGPIDAQAYGPDDFTEPAGWVHNLEHGGMVLLYRCAEGDPGCQEEAQAEIERIFDGFPNSPVCNVPPGLIGPVAARFDEMAWPYAALVWGRVLPLETLDRDLIHRFFVQEGERTNPEPQCQPPSASPAASVAPSASPSASASPSGAASPAGGSPSSEPGASASPSPAAS